MILCDSIRSHCGFKGILHNSSQHRGTNGSKAAWTVDSSSFLYANTCIVVILLNYLEASSFQKRSKYQKPGREMSLIMHIMRCEAALISIKVVELSHSSPFFIHKIKIVTVIVCDQRKNKSLLCWFHWGCRTWRIMQAVSSNIATLLFVCNR